MNARRRKLWTVWAAMGIALVGSLALCSALGISEEYGFGVIYVLLIGGFFFVSFDTEGGHTLNIASLVARRPIALTHGTRTSIQLPASTEGARTRAMRVIGLLGLLTILLIIASQLPSNSGLYVEAAAVVILVGAAMFVALRR